MISHRSQGSILIATLMVGIVVLLAISACDSAHSLPAAPAAVNPSTTASASTVATTLPTDTVVIASPTENATVALQELKAGYPGGWMADPTHAAGATEIVERNNRRLTAIALTPTTTEVPYTPEPTRTPGVGLISESDCLPPVSSGKPVFPNCWEANVNGTWLFVGAGFTGDHNGGEDGMNPFRGLIVVSLEPIEEHLGRDSATYDTPVNVGEVRIASISGSAVSVVPRDPSNHASFVFDLSTRQWVGTPGPSPSASVSPMPSVSPFPTHTALP